MDQAQMTRPPAPAAALKRIMGPATLRPESGVIWLSSWADYLLGGLRASTGMTESEHHSFQALLDRRDLEGALAYLAVLDKRAPKRASIQYHFGYVHRLLHQFDLAVRFYQEAIRLEPTTPVFHQALGIVFQQQGNYEAALRALKHAIELQPDYSNAWNSLGLTHKMSGDLPSALIAYKRAQELLVTSASLKVKAQRPEVIETHVLQSGEKGRLVTAQYFVEIKECLRSDLMYATVMNNIAHCYSELGRQGEAKSAFLESVEFIPEGATYEPPYVGLRRIELNGLTTACSRRRAEGY